MITVHPRTCLLLVIALGLVGPRTAPAQTPAEQRDLEIFRAALRQAPSAGEVRALVAQAQAGGSSAIRDLRRGFGALRLAELEPGRGNLDQAVAWFDAVQARRPAWAYPWFGLALAKLSLNAQDLLVKASRNQPEGVSYLEGYVQAFAQVFARDSAFAPALEEIRRVLLAQGERGQPAPLIRPLRAVGLGPSGTAQDALLLAREFRREGQSDSALVMLDLYWERGGDVGIEQLERGRTLASLGSPAAGARRYLEGLTHVTADSRAAYRADLAWVATPSELADFDRVPDDSLAGWVGEFWHWRDVHELRKPGERLREHLRRWAWVDGHFRVVHPERRTQFARTWIRSGGPCDRGDMRVADDILGDSTVRPYDGRHRERLYDDRAYVYMRHGEPARRIGGLSAFAPPDDPRPPATVRDNPAADPGEQVADLLLNERLEDARSNESWLYFFGGERRVFNFEGSKALGLWAPTTLSVEPLPDEQWLWTRGELDPAYYKVAVSQEGHSILPFNCRREVRELALKSRADAVVALRSDSYTLLFPKPLDPVVQTYAMGRPDLGTGRILVVFALPGKQLAARSRDQSGPEGIWYPVTARVGATDAVQRIALELDTIRNFLARDTIRSGSHLSGYLELAVPPGRYDVGASFFQADALVGGSVERTGLDLRQAPDGLYLSDVVLGRESSGMTWPYDGEEVTLNPLGAFEHAEPAQVFYELSGLIPGRQYVHLLEISPLKSSDSTERVRLRFEAVASQGAVRIHRALGLDRLKRGQYRLVVEIEETGSSRKVRRDQYLTVLN